MIRLFNGISITSIALYVLLTAVIVLDFMDVIPGWCFWICLAVVFLLQIVLIFVSMRKYSKICRIANTDINKFVAVQDKLANRSKKMKMTINGNTITALLSHEQLDEAIRRINIFQQNLNPNDLLSRYQCSSYILTADILRRDFSRIDYYANDMKMCMQQMEAIHLAGYSAKIKRSLALALEQTILEAEFYSRPAERLRNEDRQIVQNYLDNISRLYSISGSILVMRDYYLCSLDYESGVAYAVSGENEKAQEFFRRVSQTNYTYPIVTRAKEYLSTGDISIFRLPLA